MDDAGSSPPPYADLIMTTGGLGRADLDGALHGGALMKRVAAVVTALAGLYLLAALATRIAEAMGLRTCGCADDCWCKKRGLSVLRWVFPRAHRIYWPDDTRPVVQ
jgi:hypothetical protein